MSRFTTRGIPDPEGVASGGDPELTCIDAAHGSSGFLKNARSWIRDTQTRIRERLEIFTSSRGMAGAGLAAQTRFQTSFGAFPEGSALEKINLRLKSLENDWIEA